MSEYCRDSACAEPLAGSAPTQTHWLFVEAPGVWGSDAVRDCSLPQADRDALRALDDNWRVVLVRRPDRPLRRQTDRSVWLSTPDGAAVHWRLPLDHRVVPEELGAGDPLDRPALFICTNGARDRCCALFGRTLLDSLGAEGAWECSHLGGHRFAPTAVRLPDRLLFGRLTPATAAQALRGETPIDCLRGPAGWPEQVQAAAVAVWARHGWVPIVSAQEASGAVRLSLADGTGWQVPVDAVHLRPRLVSCGAPPRTGSVVRTGPPSPVPAQQRTPVPPR